MVCGIFDWNFSMRICDVFFMFLALFLKKPVDLISFSSCFRSALA